MNSRLRSPRSVGRPVPGRAPRLRRPHRLGHRLLRLSAFAGPLLMGAAASAAYPTRTVGAWVVAESSDRKGCFLSRTYPSPRQTTLQLGLDIDGSNRLTILNANWSIRPRERLTMDFRLSNAAFPRHVAIGLATQGKKGFVTSFGTSFPASIAASRFLHVRRRDVTVEELDLDGSGAAIAALRQCVGQHRSSPGAASAARGGEDRIPADPFAAASRRDSRE